MIWTTEATKYPNTTVIRARYTQDKTHGAPWSMRVMLSGDRHHDNPQTRQDLEKRHLDEAKAAGAAIIDVGDLFDAMQGKGDKRHQKSDLRPEHQVSNYFDALVDTAYDFYAPYAANFAMLGVGNHENSVFNHHETDLTARLAQRLGCPKGAYRGWVRFMFERETGGGRQSIRMFYTHGHGGASPVTRGTIQTNRNQAVVDGADIFVSGHIHEAWSMEIPRFRLTDGSVPVKDSAWHICVPTYKDEIGTTGNGWAEEKGLNPKPLGAWWMDLYLEGGKIKYEFTRTRQ
jgi:hypothetical protein